MTQPCFAAWPSILYHGSFPSNIDDDPCDGHCHDFNCNSESCGGRMEKRPGLGINRGVDQSMLLTLIIVLVTYLAVDTIKGRMLKRKLERDERKLLPGRIILSH